MSLQWFRSAVVTLIKLTLVFGRHPMRYGREFSDNCDNSPNSLSCIHTYETLYNSLAKSENSFNIESAIYPFGRPSSVRVFVNLHGPNETENLIVPYTWSLSCLYVAVPPPILEVLSLGSILVTPRTQTLNITIPYFCCNVSKSIVERRRIINERIKRALASLQDLAVSPGIRDPRMNTAECVIEGHGIDIEATGRSVYIRIIQWCSFFFTLPVSYILASFIQHCRITGSSEKTAEREHTNTTGRDRQKIRIKNSAKAIYSLSILLSVLGSMQLLLLFSLMANFFREEGFSFMDIALILFLIVTTTAGNVFFGPNIPKILENYFPWLMTHEAFMIEDMNCFQWDQKMVPYLCAATTSFSSCWMLIGIMLNPTWGLTVTLIIYFAFACFAYAVCEYLTLTSSEQDWVKSEKQQALYPGLFGILAVIVLIPVILFASPSFNGRETADEALKTILTTAIGSLIWLAWKRLLDKSQKPEEEQTQLEVRDSTRAPSSVSTSSYHSADDLITPETVC